uniref:Uncharacterized protein n=1 Tax=Arundo donax TaxID=35708 RepID=A0A0A9HRZ0_ARUDO
MANKRTVLFPMANKEFPLFFIGGVLCREAMELFFRKRSKSAALFFKQEKQKFSFYSSWLTLKERNT